MSNIPAKFTQPCGSIYFLDFLGECRGQIDRILHMNLYAHKYTKQVASCIFQNQNHVVYQCLLHKSVAIYIGHTPLPKLLLYPLCLVMYVVSLEWMDIIATLEILEPSQPRAEIALQRFGLPTGFVPLKKKVGRSRTWIQSSTFYCFRLDPGITMYNLKILMTRKKRWIKRGPSPMCHPPKK